MNHNFVGYRIEYEIAVPGRQTKIIGRKILDLVDEDARRANRLDIDISSINRLGVAVAMSSVTDILIQGANYSVDFGQALIVHQVLAESGAVLETYTIDVGNRP